jgi:hypothetical protein
MKRIDSDWGADDGGDHGLSMSMVVVVGFDFGCRGLSTLSLSSSSMI